MRNAKQFRQMAKHVLENRYWWAVLAALVFMLLSGLGAPAVTWRTELDEIAPAAAGLPATLKNIADFFAGFQAGLLWSLVAVAFLFVGAAVELGYNRYHIRQYEIAEAPGLELLFSRFSIFWRAVGLRLLIMLKVFLWSLLFIVPGIVASLRYALAPYILAENPDMPVKEAIERSKALMQGHKARLFRLCLSFIGWFLLSCLTAGVGMVFLAPYVKTAITGFYLELSGRLPLPDPAQPAQKPAPAAIEPPRAEEISEPVEMI